MKLALAGMGQMGRAIEALASEHGHEVVARFDLDRPFLDVDGPDALNGAEVVIEFTWPTTVLGHIERCCRWQVPIVVGTTGWYDRFDIVRQWVGAYDATVMYASNYSMGVALLAHAIRSLTPLLEQLPDYDAYVHELHHIRKADSPSGTALMLGRLLVDGLSRKTHIESETQHQRIDPAALHVSSTRTGDIYGHHTVGIDGPYDRLSFIHDAKSRQGFADGALRAAAWLKGRKGLFTLDDMLSDWLAESKQPEPVGS